MCSNRIRKQRFLSSLIRSKRRAVRYTKVGDFYRVSRTTGPTHNLMGLSLSHENPTEVAVQRLRETESNPLIDERQLKRADLDGVSPANAALGTNYHVEVIQYVPSDTLDVNVYLFLAKSLIEQFVRSEELSAGHSQPA